MMDGGGVSIDLFSALSNQLMSRWVSSSRFLSQRSSITEAVTLIEHTIGVLND